MVINKQLHVGFRRATDPVPVALTCPSGSFTSVTCTSPVLPTLPPEIHSPTSQRNGVPSPNVLRSYIERVLFRAWIGSYLVQNVLGYLQKLNALFMIL